MDRQVGWDEVETRKNITMSWKFCYLFSQTPITVFSPWLHIC